MAVETISTVFLGVDSTSGVSYAAHVNVQDVMGGDKILTCVTIVGTGSEGGGLTGAVGEDVSGHFTEFVPESGVFLQKSGVDLHATTLLATVQRGSWGE